MRSIHQERGAELIELAIVLPLLMLLFAAVVDFGLMFQRYLVVTNAAREGARIAVLPEYNKPADVVARATQYVQEGLGDNTLAPTVTYATRLIDPDAGGPAPGFTAADVTVELTHNYVVLGPVVSLVTGGSFGSVTLAARSTMRVE